MKALLINGSPQKTKSTYTALMQVARGLEAGGIEHELAWLGGKPIKPCMACGVCDKTQRCAYGDDDGVNALIEKLQGADALVVGSPVFYAGINGSLKATLDRMFFAAGSTYAFKPGGAVVCARRAGTTVALDQIHKYFTISQMPVVSSFYWTAMHGHNADEVVKDVEGVQSAYQLGANMAWLLKCIEAGHAAGIEPVPFEGRSWTNFIR